MVVFLKVVIEAVFVMVEVILLVVALGFATVIDVVGFVTDVGCFRFQLIAKYSFNTMSVIGYDVG